MRTVRFLLLVLMSLWLAPAHADKFSDSYLFLDAKEKLVEGQWDIALRDLDNVIGLDRDGDGAITWDETRSKNAEIAAYALPRLALSTPRGNCQLSAGEQLVDHHSDGAYIVLRFQASCPSTIDSLTIRYSLLFDVDPQHKGLLKLKGNGSTLTGIFSADQRVGTFSTSKPSQLQDFVAYVKTGIWHIWTGFDHLLFLFSLLLPAVLYSSGARWQPSSSFKASCLDVLKIVTAFTVSHSLTLSLATLHIVTLPSRWVESAIAASVIVAALNNLYPVVRGRRWLVAFAFGLVHGFGFATVLTDLALPPAQLTLALVGFNCGVELGQLVIVAIFLPFAFVLRRTWLYQRVAVIAGSLMITAVASIWLIERAFDLRLIT